MIDKTILMKIQYELPLTETPFLDLADEIGIDPEDLMDRLRKYKNEGIIKRIGANLNYKAFGKIGKAVLVAFACDDRIAEIINEIPNLKHNYLRDHPRYKVWFTFKGRDVEELRRIVEEVASKSGVSDYLFLPSKRVYKMDVKYDLFKGISWSEKGLEREDVPKMEDLGIDADMLFELERRLPIAERPFKPIADKYGYTEAEIVDLLKELINKGVVRDFSGVLRERKIGFTENGMNLVKVEDAESLALKLVEEFPQITHLVEREVPEEWPYPLYFMVHADSREKIERVRREIEERYGVEILTLYSIRNLNPKL